MQLKGAEAIVEIKDNIVIKKRIPKPYRIKEFDELIRKKRTKKEVSILKKLSYVINVPKIKEIRDFEIIMEKIEATPLKEVKKLDDKLWKKLGEEISKIHDQGIIHGDLTTKNILFDGENFFFIDFGLSFYSSKIEDKATDLIVLKEILELENRGKKFYLIMEGYRDKEKEKILKKIEEIEERGRYKRKIKK